MTAMLFVKDAGDTVKIYREMPANVVAPDLYRKAHASAIEGILGGFRGGYLLRDLNTKGIAVLGRKNTLKKHIRSAVKGGTEVNTMQVSSQNQGGTSSDAMQRKLDALARGRETARKNREARKNASQPQQQDENTMLVLDTPDAASLPAGQQNIINNLVRMGEFDEANKLLAKWS